MANTHKTKAEMLQELESIKGLLLEQDDIPVLQEIEDESPLLLQSSLFDPAPKPFTGHQETFFSHSDEVASLKNYIPQANRPVPLSDSKYATPFGQQTSRPLAKASGENPFLPQHIRERLHGNNPPPLFEYETAKKIINATKNIDNKINKPRQHLVDDIITSLMPQIESELRHRLFAMSIEELQTLLDAEG